MFTGVIEKMGVVRSLSVNTQQGCLRVGCPSVKSVGSDWGLESFKLGDSLAVQGVCLTITHRETSPAGELLLQFDLGSETLRRTNLSELTTGDKVHLERPLCLNDRLHGHLVQGHVDNLGELRQQHPEGDSLLLKVAVPKSLFRYLIPQGSIAVDGVSLTIGSLPESTSEYWFSFMLTPYTQQQTTLATKKLGEKLNLEVDMMAKYASHLLSRIPS